MAVRKLRNWVAGLLLGLTWLIIAGPWAVRSRHTVSGHYYTVFGHQVPDWLVEGVLSACLCAVVLWAPVLVLLIILAAVAARQR